MIPDGKLRKTEHILKSGDFRNIYKKGRRAKFETVVLHCLPNEHEHSRLGFSISSRNVKQASKRNRIKRLFREIYRKTKKDLKKGFDLILVVRSDFGGRISYTKLETIYSKLAKSMGLLL